MKHAHLLSCASASALALTVLCANPAHANATDTAALNKLSKATAPFVPNAGQWDERAAFAAQTLAGTVFVTKKGELIYSLPGKPIAYPEGASPLDTLTKKHAAPTERGPGWALSESFVSASGEMLKATPDGFRPAASKVSYFIGPDETKHQRGLNTYDRVNLGNVYPGINVQLRATGNNIEKIFTVAPLQNPAQIRVKLSGATQLEVNAQGELIAHTDNGPIAYTAPIAFQEDAQGNKESVAVQYALNTQQNTYAFALAAYDTSRPLIIDPLIKSSYLGGSGTDAANRVAIHPNTGNVYFVGSTDSPGISFPTVAGGAQRINAGNTDAFVAYFDPSLTNQLGLTFLGAGATDVATTVAIHPVTGDVYVGGKTDSTGSTFPGVAGGAQGSSGGGTDVFISRFAPDLTTLHNSTYLGGSGADIASAAAFDAITRDLYVVGYTNSPSNTFPGVAGGAQGSFGGGTDAFVSRFNSDLTTLFKSSYLGAAGTDAATALAIDAATGDVYVAGYTTSPGNSFPGVAGGAQGSFGGGTDAFVSRFNSDLTTLFKSSYFGGPGGDVAYAVAIHPFTGNVFIGGYTTDIGLPNVAGGAQSSFGGGYDAFVARLNADLTRVIQATYLGGAGTDIANALAIHPNTGEVYVAGFTDATTNTFPGVAGGAQGSSGGGIDGFVSRFNADLTRIIQSSYLGAAGTDQVNAVAFDPLDAIPFTTFTVVGYTSSPGNSFPGVAGAAQGSFGGGLYDAFASRFNPDLTASNTTPNSFKFITQANVPVSSVRTSNPALITGIVSAAAIYVDGAPGSTYCISSSNSCSCDLSAGFVSVPGSINNGTYVCARQTSALLADVGTKTLVHIGGAASPFVTITGTAFVPCNLNMGGGIEITTTKEGLVLLRAMLGLTGSATTTGTGVTAAQWTTARPLINANCGTNFPADTSPSVSLTLVAQTNVALASVRTSSPAQVTGLSGSAAITVDGTAGSSYLVSPTNSCASGTFMTTAGTITNGQYVCAKHTSAPARDAVTQTTVHIGSTASTFFAITGTAFAPCRLNMDGGTLLLGNNEGLVLLRAMMGFTGLASTSGTGITAAQWAATRPLINANCGTNFPP